LKFYLLNLGVVKKLAQATMVEEEDEEDEMSSPFLSLV